MADFFGMVGSTILLDPNMARPWLSFAHARNLPMYVCTVFYFTVYYISSITYMIFIYTYTFWFCFILCYIVLYVFCKILFHVISYFHMIYVCHRMKASRSSPDDACEIGGLLLCPMMLLFFQLIQLDEMDSSSYYSKLSSITVIS